MSRIDELAVGDRLPTLEKEFSRPQLFRYSAITWNSHRIHYDPEYAREVEGHPDVLVQAQLHGAAVQQQLLDWAGTDGELVELSWRNVGRATPDDQYAVEAEVAAIDRDSRTVDFEIWAETADHRCIEGTAAVRFTD